MEIVHGNRICKLVANLSVVPSICRVGTIISGREINIGSGIIHRRCCNNIHYPSHRISSEKGTLWSSEHLNALDIEEIKIKSSSFKVWHIVDIKTNRR